MLAALAPILLMKMIETMGQVKENKSQRANEDEIMDLAANDSEVTKDRAAYGDILADNYEKKEVSTPKTFSAANKVAAARERNPKTEEELDVGVEEDAPKEDEALKEFDSSPYPGSALLDLDSSKPAFKMPDMNPNIVVPDQMAEKAGQAQRIEQMMQMIEGIGSGASKGYNWLEGKRNKGKPSTMKAL